ncbi:glucokinase [Melghiribacillus thermohalophilus]|uniref:Glucokinase n=1 Tax=Melghiribacillus thermohalophilus TaxID=1324956 RepID=A0A4R3NDG0_9BACI|nr:ROK family glucokinase [Melghiribacillus thermohalophilus]TCT26966.1 glucokinase [Melghiribacillus thermohalophilus]
MNKRVFLGADIGGTFIKLAIMDGQGNIIKKWSIETNTSDQGRHIPLEIYESFSKHLEMENLTFEHIYGLGIGAPGFVDLSSGIVYEAVNIGWKDFNLKQAMESYIHQPVFVSNDANLAALGENWKGAGKNVEDLIMVTLGTGVGGGVITSGQVINGINGTGGEIGHITVSPQDGPLCNCGRRGCIETYASATGIARMGYEAVQNGKETSLKEIMNLNGRITAKDVFEEAKKDDQVCRKIIEKVTDLLGLVLSNLAIAINPKKIVIGGGVANAGEELLSPLKKSFRRYCLPRTADACTFQLAELGNDAGVIGGAYLVKKQLYLYK